MRYLPSVVLAGVTLCALIAGCSSSPARTSAGTAPRTGAGGSGVSTSPATTPTSLDLNLPGGLKPAAAAPAYGGPLRALSADFPLAAFLAHEKQDWQITPVQQAPTGQEPQDKKTWLVGRATVAGQSLALWISLDSKQRVTSVHCDSYKGLSAVGERFVDDCARFPFPGADTGQAGDWIARERTAIAEAESDMKYVGVQLVAPVGHFGDAAYYFSKAQSGESLIIMGEPS